MMDDAARLLESGVPPDWFPPDKQIDFRGKRRDLLAVMPLVDLTATVDEIIEMRRDNFADLNYLKHEFRPATINGIPDAVGHACAILSRYLYAASLGEEKGLPLLLGDEHAGLAIHGKQMRKGRKVGSYSPWKKWIERHLKRDLSLKPANLWEMLKNCPPRGWIATESARLERYIEAPTGSADDVTYKRFQDAVAEVRMSLKAQMKR